MKFLFLNRNINFIESEDLKITQTDNISVNPVYLASLAENLNLIDSYIYYINLSEKFYSINEFDLYFLKTPTAFAILSEPTWFMFFTFILTIFFIFLSFNSINLILYFCLINFFNFK